MPAEIRTRKSKEEGKRGKRGASVMCSRGVPRPRAQQRHHRSWGEEKSLHCGCESDSSAQNPRRSEGHRDGEGNELNK